MGFLLELSIINRLLLVAGLIAALSGVYGIWHHTIYKSGEMACQARYEAASAAQKNKAQKQISTVGVKYAQIDTNLQNNSGFMLPVSPLVSGTIDRMPIPQHDAK